MIRRQLVSARKDGASRGGRTAMNADARASGVAMAQDGIRVERDAAHGCSRFFLNGGFAVVVSTPISEGKPGLDGLLEFVVGTGFVSIRAAEGQGLVEQRLLDFGE